VYTSPLLELNLELYALFEGSLSYFAQNFDFLLISYRFFPACYPADQDRPTGIKISLLLLSECFGVLGFNCFALAQF